MGRHATASGQRRYFVVCPALGGLWLARESHGFVEGVFRRRKDALRFALCEGGTDNIVCLSPGCATPSFLGIQDP